MGSTRRGSRGCPLIERGQGFRDGGEDVNDFRTATLRGRVVPLRSLLMRSAMGEARIAMDAAGNSETDEVRRRQAVARPGRCRGGGDPRGGDRRAASQDRATAAPTAHGDCRLMANRGSRHHRALDRRRWARVRRVVLNRDGWRCRRCLRYGNQCDHVRPLDRGGDPWDPANLQTLCRTCHVAKTAAENRKPDPARDAWRKLVAELNSC